MRSIPATSKQYSTVSLVRSGSYVGRTLLLEDGPMKKALLFVLTLMVGGCASTTTRLASIAPEAVEAEEVRQREIVLIELNKAQQRLDDIAFELLEAAAPLCKEDVAPKLGIAFKTAGQYEGGYEDAARSALGLSDVPTLTSVSSGSPAADVGLEEGDQLLAVEGSRLPVGEEGLEVASESIRLAALSGVVNLTVGRSGREIEVSVIPKNVCAYPAVVKIEGEVNAFADGERVIFSWAMMRFTNDDELRTIVGHEIAHNAMGHLDAKKKNALIGGIFGAVLDVATQMSTGVPTEGANTAAFMNDGAAMHSQDFEREADYVGMYILARANIDLDKSPDVWRQMGQISPRAIAYASSHPSNAERFVRLSQTIDEIRQKRSMGLELFPEMKDP